MKDGIAVGQTPTDERSYKVTRTDDNGQTYLVQEMLTYEEADALRELFSARGHKQDYSVVVSEPSAGMSW